MKSKSKIMKNYNYKIVLRQSFLKWKILLMVVLFTLSISGFAQTRSGGVNLSGDEGRWFDAFNSSGDHPLAGKTGGDNNDHQPFSIELWVKILSNNSDDMCLWNMKSDDNRVSLIYKSDSEFKLVVDGSATNGDGDIDGWSWTFDEYTADVTFLNNWAHVAFTYDGYNRVELYINGDYKKGKNLYKSQVDDDHKIIHLMPQEGNGGYLEIGGRDKDGVRGKAYVSDVRIWEIELSSTNIVKYYDEELNSHHPNWANLIRYYPCTDDYLDGSDDPRIEDEMNNYDADVSDDDVRVGAYYPPIHPPRLSGTSTSFRADDCQTSRIDVDWSDFQGWSSYRKEDTPGYSIQRKIGNGSFSTIYEGNNYYYDDVEINAGELITYRLYTYWDINGTNSYSNDYVETTGSWKEVYNAPTNIQATMDNCDKTINITWDYSGTNSRLWKVQRATNSGFSSGLTTLTTTLSGDDRSYTNSPNIETSYWYKVTADGSYSDEEEILVILEIIIHLRHRASHQNPHRYQQTLP